MGTRFGKSCDTRSSVMAQTATHEEVGLELIADGGRAVVADQAQGVGGQERAHLAE